MDFLIKYKLLNPSQILQMTLNCLEKLRKLEIKNLQDDIDK